MIFESRFVLYGIQNFILLDVVNSVNNQVHLDKSLYCTVTLNYLCSFNFYSRGSILTFYIRTLLHPVGSHLQIPVFSTPLYLISLLTLKLPARAYYFEQYSPKRWTCLYFSLIQSSGVNLLM